jgi:hypothetical protein
VRIKVGASFYDVYPDASTTKFSLSSKISAAIVNYNDGVAAASASTTLNSLVSGSTDATVAIWYDQSGNGVNVLNASALAKIITSGTINTMNGQPTINFTSANSYLTSSATVNYSSQTVATLNAAVQDVASTDYISGIISTGNNGGWGLIYDPTTTIKGYWVDASGGNGAFSNENTRDVKIVTGLVGKTTNSYIYVNSQLKGNRTAQSIAHSSADNIYVGVRGNASNRKFIGNISEVFMFPKTLTAAEQTALETSQSIFIGPSVTIASSASGAVCAGTSVTFTATTSNFSGTPTYQWYKNGTAISGANSSTYTSTTLSNNEVIKVSAGDAIVTNSLIQNLDANNASSYSSGNTWTDLTVNGNNGTIVTGSSGSVAIATEGAIKSFSFTKGLSYIAAPVTKTASMSFNVWAKTSSLTNYNSPGTMLFNAGASGTGWQTGGPTLYIVGNKLFWNTYDGTDNPFKLNGIDITPTTAAINDTNWHYFSVVVDAAANTASLYIDGVLKGVAVYKDPRAFSSTALFIGGEGNNANITNYDLAWVGNISAFQSYSRALSSTEVVQNFNSKAAFFGANSAALTVSNSITASITGSAPILTVTGDSCINKTTLSTPAGATAYAWYKDNAPISGATSNTYSPTTAGDYKVQVTSGSCASMSEATTISVCGVTADGRMSIFSSSTTLVSREGEINNRKGVDDRGLILTNSVTPITTGLMLYLDATKSASYGGSGTTWNDISGQLPAGSATLVGSPPYSSGSFTFGDNMNASTSKTYTISNQLTLIAWVNPSQIQSAFTGVIFRRTSSDGGGTGMFISGNNLHYDWDNQDWSWRSDLLVPNDQWSMIVISVKETELTAYLCNASGISSVIRGKGHGSLTSRGATNFHIGLDPYPGREFKGKMGTAMVYSVGLSTDDITTIFNSQKAAFGIN